MTVYFISRHAGAQRWARYHDSRGELPLHIDRYEEHFDPRWTEPGDVVIGTLPLNVIAELQARGGQFVSLDLQTPPHRRGQELTATEMTAMGALLTPYRVQALETRSVAARAAPGRAAERDDRRLMLMLVSDQLQPQLIGLDLNPSTYAWLVHTPAMRAKAKHLSTMLARWPRPVSATLVPIDDVPFHQLQGVARTVLAQAEQAGFGAIVLNATGGTKPMMMAFAQATLDAQRQEAPVQLCYVDTATKSADDFNSGKPRSLRRVLNIEQLIECSQRRLAGAAHPAEEFRKQMARTTLHHQMLRASGNFLELLNGCLAQHARDWEERKGRRGQVTVERWLANVLNRYGSDGQPSIAALWHQAGVLDREPEFAQDRGELSLRSEAELAYLRGGWLEAHVARLLSTCGADDWAAGLQVVGENAAGEDAAKANELDGVIAAGNRLLVIEVKTARQLRKKGGGKGDGSERNAVAEQAFYKLDSLGTQLAPLFSARWYVSALPLDAADLERAKNLRIRVFAPGTGPLHEHIAELPNALAQWVRESQGEMPASELLRPSTVGVDLKKWGPAATKPYAAAPDPLGSSVKPGAQDKLRALKLQIQAASPTTGAASSAGSANPPERSSKRNRTR